MRAFAAIAVVTFLVQAPPPGGGPWPPNGVYPSSVVDTPPKLVQRIDPTYTPAAVRGRIEGIVHLVCVVNADGTVGETRITKSLDAASGIDAAAVDAVRQWRFSPAIRNGNPVAVSIDVEVGVSLRGMPRSTSWPDGFGPPAPPFLAAAEWHADTIEADGVRIEIAVPPAWTLSRPQDGRTLTMLRKNGTSTTFSIMRTREVTYDLDRQMTPAELQRRAADAERSSGARQMGAEAIGAGQAQAAGHLWAWHAYKTQTAVPPNLDPTLASSADKMFESVRSWTLEATAGGHAIDVLCFTLVPRNGTDEDKASWVRDQAAVFGEILRRTKISLTPEPRQ